MNTSLEFIPCNLCGSKEHISLYTGIAGKVVRCAQCGLIFINPRLPKEKETDFYISKYYDFPSSKEAHKLRTRVYKGILERIHNYVNSGRLLDIGCGFGYFLKMAQNEGWEVHGLELSAKAGKFAKERLNLDIRQERLRDSRYPNDFFNVVTLINVLDHFPEPKDELQEVYRILKDGGLLVIRIPNMIFHLPFQKFVLREGNLGENLSLGRFTPFHLYGFTPQTIRTMLSKIGFDKIQIINAKVSTGDPTASLNWINILVLQLVKQIFFSLAQIIFFLSRGSAIIGTSVEIYAFKNSKKVPEHFSLSDGPKVSVIIPSFDGYRKGNLSRLVEGLKEQSFRDFEVIIIKGVSPQGKAINMGAAKAKGEILVTMDDDSSLGNKGTLKNLIQVFQTDSKIGMVGASITVSPEANWFQRQAAKEFPRFNMPIVKEILESDMACHGCCAIPKNIFREVGGERENILRGLDPDLRHRLRQAGYKVVLAPNAWAYHPLPKNFLRLLRTFFRNGMGSAYLLKFHSDLIYETDEKIDSSDFKPKTSFVFRLFRFPLRLLRAIFSFQLLRFSAYSVYALGYCFGLIKYSLFPERELR